jgi:ABC-2 type transport system ATP-binding protein
VLSIRGVEKSYGDIRALRGASLEVAAGSIVSLLGRNGAGKSTLLSIVAGLLKPDAGSVSVDGVDLLKNARKATGLVGIAPQHTGIYPTLTVRENLEFFGELAGLKRADRSQRATEIASQLGLSDLLTRKGMKLSGGEQRRLHTGCALVHRPKVLMLDEPTVGADVTTRVQLIDAVKRLAAEGAAIVYTTHYLPEVESLDASIVIIENGAVLASGTREELVAKHQMSGVQFETVSPLAETVLNELGVEQMSNQMYRLLGDIDMRGLLNRLDAYEVGVVSVETIRPDLESVFLSITGSALVEALVEATS